MADLGGIERESMATMGDVGSAQPIS